MKLGVESGLEVVDLDRAGSSAGTVRATAGIPRIHTEITDQADFHGAVLKKGGNLLFHYYGKKGKKAGGTKV